MKELGFSHVSARPKAYKQDAEAISALKKIAPISGSLCPPQLGAWVFFGRETHALLAQYVRVTVQC